MSGTLPFSDHRERMPFVAIQRENRAHAIRCHSLPFSEHNRANAIMIRSLLTIF